MTEVSRTILHADMDAFYAAIEQRDRPELRGKPVIIGGDGPRQVVSTASYEAREYGVHSAMPGRRARQLCPHGIFVRPRMEVYAECSEKVRAVFDQYTDLVEPLSLDEAFLDVTGSFALFGDGPTIAARIRHEVRERTGLTVSVGVATSKYVAKVASDVNKPDGMTIVPPGSERAFLAELPLSRLWGVGLATRSSLERAGLRTIADVQSRSREQLVEGFGENLGEHLFVLANGLDARPVVAERAAKSIGHEMAFAEDLVERDDVHALLLQLCEMVGRRLRRAGQRARVVRLKLRHPPFETKQRQRKLPQPTDDDLALHATARELLALAWGSRRPVRLLGVTGADLADADERDLEPKPQQQSLFGEASQVAEGAASEPNAKQRDKLLRAMDAIRDRHGEDAVHHAGGQGIDGQGTGTGGKGKNGQRSSRGGINAWGPDRADRSGGGDREEERRRR